MNKQENELVIIPDSHKLQVAFWEAFKHPEVLLERYRAGMDVSSIAKEYGRSRDSLSEFFGSRFGKNWHKRTAAAIKVSTQHRPDIKTKEIIERLKRGERQIDIAVKIGVKTHVVYSRIKRYREMEMEKANA